MDPTLTGLAGALPTLAAAAGWAWSQRRGARLQRELEATRARYAQALRQEKTQTELFRTLFDAAPECVKLHDADGVVMRINAAGLGLLETDDLRRIVDRPVYSVIAGDYHAAYRELTSAVFAGHARSMEFELNTFRGRRRWLETHAVPLRDEQGEVIALLAVTRDIDERRAMTRLLLEQRNRLHTIIESEPECVKLQDRQGVIIEMNPAGLALLSADDPQQVIGRTVYDFLEPDYLDAYRRLTDDVFAGQRRSMEFEVMTTRGERRWLETHAAPLRDSSGEVSALLAITRDIDGRKRDEEKLRRQQDELAHVCRLSTLGELASGLAHELNQPLCALSSYAESALSAQQGKARHAPAQVTAILEKIVREAARANGIINRLREFVRKRTPLPRPNAVAELVDTVLHIVEAERCRRRVSIEVSLPAALPLVSVDRVQAEQILLNLVNNAIQAVADCDTERRRIEVSVNSDGERVRIALRDFADGIPEALRTQLFTPFFTTKANGIGMGLALSRSIAESFGAQLLYTPSEPGSTFSLYLPISRGDA